MLTHIDANVPINSGYRLYVYQEVREVVASSPQEISGTTYFGDRLGHTKTMALLHAALSDDIFSAFDLGRAMTWGQVVRQAFETVDR